MLHLHVDGAILTRSRNGPHIRAINLMAGLDNYGILYVIDGTIGEINFALHPGAFNTRCEELPACTPVGPNISHDARSHTALGTKFKNIVVQGAWVADYWKWYDTELTKDCAFYVWPSGVDCTLFQPSGKDEKAIDCLWYSKYQNEGNSDVVKSLLDSCGQSYTRINYGEYGIEGFKKALHFSKYCIYQSCCEKSSHALLEILASGLPVFVVDSFRWIGDDKFDRATSAPDFSPECGEISRYGSGMSGSFDSFLTNLNTYSPREYVLKNRTIRHFVERFLEITNSCHGTDLKCES